ncbi:MAG: FtsX-like permease family protein, partial [Bernardetiaceae bacterium]|nr:FtsX-like permease family protein [Bernardetiaceae bacterium]
MAVGDKKFVRSGNYAEPDLPEMLALKMLVRLDNRSDLKVTGVYEDLPHNTSLREIKFLLPWSLYLVNEPWVKRSENEWDNNSFQIFAQLKPGADFAQVSAKIKDIKKVNDPNTVPFNPQIFLHPMSRAFVLLLACINFMNLSTAQSERRAKEVGVRKTVGSGRGQLMGQFLGESLLMASLAFGLSLGLGWASLFWFNQVADKQMGILWAEPGFWLACLAFILVTGLLAGSYPAFYLSSFNPVKVLKGTFKAGRFATLPRKVLVVVQFTVSIALVVGTLVVFRQVQHAKDRPLGYQRDGLVALPMNTPELYGHYDAIRNDLLASAGAADMCQSSSAVTGVWSNQIGFSWQGMPPDLQPLFGTIAVT